jgi:hypothetical protein
MNGTEFVSRLRDVDSSVPLAVLSALPKEAEKELADNVKDVRIFTKPAENSKAVTEHVIPNIIAAAEKPALPLKGDAKAAPAKPEPGKA